MRALLTLLFVTAAGTAPAADPPAPTARAAAIHIVRPPTDIPGVVLTGANTSLGVIASLPERAVVALDPGACKLAFTDDKDTDLAAGRALTVSPTVGFINSNSLVQFQVGAPNVPAAAATKVRLKGDLVFLCGVGEKTVTGQGLVLKAKEKATAGPVEFEVVQNGNALVIRVRSAQPLVKSIAFLDQDKKVGAGAVVLAVEDGKVIQKGEFVVPPNTQAVGISVTHYEKVEPVTVPIDAAMGVGR